MVGILTRDSVLAGETLITIVITDLTIPAGTGHLVMVRTGLVIDTGITMDIMAITRLIMVRTGITMIMAMLIVIMFLLVR